MEYHTFTSPFGTFSIVWKGKEPNFKIQRIFVSDPKQKSEKKLLKSFNSIKEGSSPSIELLGKNIKSFLKGVDIKFDLGILNFHKCSETQKKVLLSENDIPRGWVSTYKRIAYHIDIKNGARVVGNSLARNPFPIVIPCHRAIKSNGELGGYQGGIKMKRKLLELEGVEFSSKGKVITERIYY